MAAAIFGEISMRGPGWLLALCLGAVGPACASEASQPALPPLCTDRPTKSTGPCTVDQGHWQVETDLADMTDASSGGVKTRTWTLASPTLKYGLTRTLDIEFNPSPYLSTRTTDHGSRDHVAGLGDTILRLKSVLASGKTAVSISPFVKLPTARRGLGNGKVEGGVVLPVQLALSDDLQLLFDPELDALENDAGNGRHLNAAGLVSLTKSVTPTTSFSAEIWAGKNFEPSGTVTQVSADLGLAWIPTWNQDLQWDTGVNIGLNKATPRQQIYLGLSRRF